MTQLSTVAAAASPDILDTLDRDELEAALLAARRLAADLETRLAALAAPRERHLHLVRTGELS